MKRSANLTCEQVADAVRIHGSARAAADALGCTIGAVEKRMRQHRREQAALGAAAQAEDDARAEVRERRIASAQPSDWRASGACLEEDPELFFPIGSTGPALLQIEEAKAVCRRCDVVETCLRWALDSGEDAGVWGGLSEDERRSLKRRNARARRAA